MTYFAIQIEPQISQRFFTLPAREKTKNYIYIVVICTSIEIVYFKKIILYQLFLDSISPPELPMFLAYSENMGFRSNSLVQVLCAVHVIFETF